MMIVAWPGYAHADMTGFANESFSTAQCTYLKCTAV